MKFDNTKIRINMKNNSDRFLPKFYLNGKYMGCNIINTVTTELESKSKFLWYLN